MVPGMTERERLAADSRRLAWLADTRPSPVRTGGAAPRPATEGPLPALINDMCRRGLSAAGSLRERIRLLRPQPGAAIAKHAEAPVR